MVIFLLEQSLLLHYCWSEINSAIVLLQTWCCAHMVLCVHFQVKELKTWSETFEVKEEGVLFTALYGAVVCCGLGCAF